MISKKICLIGDFGVGKTSLIRRFVDQQFSDQYLSTIGVKISRKVVKVESAQEHQDMQLMIWDIEGQTKFQPLNHGYLQGTAGAIIVCDLTRQDTVDRLQEYLDLVYTTNPRGVRVIAAFNKSDLLPPERLEPFYQWAQDLALSQQNQAQKLHPYITSAKTGKNVEQIFQKLASLMLEQP